jgi:hypothetical protein
MVHAVSPMWIWVQAITIVFIVTGIVIAAIKL